MRFACGWDSNLKRWLTCAEQQSNFHRAVLSSYPPPYMVGRLLHLSLAFVSTESLLLCKMACELT